MQRINHGAALAVIVKPHSHRQGEQFGKALAERRVAGDLAADVADHPAQSGAQKFEFASRPFELVRVGVASDHDRRALGPAPIALPQGHAVMARQFDQLRRARWHSRASVARARFWLHRGVDDHPLEVARRPYPGLVRHRQALLNQRGQRLLTQPLAPKRQ